MRTAVMLRYFEDMTEPEIAAALGISLGTVKSTVSRAVAKLRIDAELGADGDGDPLPLSVTGDPSPAMTSDLLFMSDTCQYRVTPH